MYFIRKVFIHAETYYQNIEKLSLAFVMVRKLRPYFQGHKIFAKTNYLFCHVLKKSYMAARMVSWVVELTEYDIQYVPGGSIKSQALAYFVA